MKNILLLIFLTITFVGFGQEKSEDAFYRKAPFYIGVGVGMDYGGLGGKFEYMFADFTGLFVGVGTNFNGLGINGGAVFKPLHKKILTPYFIGMYGYTATIRVQNASQYDMTDYGFSLGGGISFKTLNLNVWQIGIVAPFRSEEFKNHYEYLKDHPYIELENSLLPIQFTLGFKMLIN
jgi:hypothetical protein